MFLVCLSVCVVYWLVGCLFSCLFFGCLVVLVVVNVVVVVLVLALLPVSVPRYLVVSCPAIPIGHYFLARCGEPCVGQGGDPSKNFGAKKALRLFSGSLAAGRVGAIPSLNLMTWWLGPGFSERLQQMTGFGRGIGINLYKDYIRGVWKSLDEWNGEEQCFWATGKPRIVGNLWTPHPIFKFKCIYKTWRFKCDTAVCIFQVFGHAMFHPLTNGRKKGENVC